jgi:hypothetical protein
MVSFRQAAAHAPVRRLASPTGFALAGLCLLLPFVTGSCSNDRPEYPEAQGEFWRVTYTGVDLLTGGRPAIAWNESQRPGGLRQLDEAGLIHLLGELPAPLRPQPLAWLALALIAIAVVSTAVWWRTRWSGIVAATAAMGAAIALYAAALRARDHGVDMTASIFQDIAEYAAARRTPVREWGHYPLVRDQFHLDYGLWVAVGLLLAVGGITLGLAVTQRASAGPRRHRDLSPEPDVHESDAV